MVGLRLVENYIEQRIGFNFLLNKRMIIENFKKFKQ